MPDERALAAEQEAKLQALRDHINAAIDKGGSRTDEEVRMAVEAELDAWEAERANQTRSP
ncbi:hypothetical protein [Sphingomonas sp.]|uniref:hypothetical protein n=1 Tax=Sphingomonas sp. TaxID=28214 RepID=UPI001AFD748F|nr:hypothetical protein [Sphingomonas sp.]MBO9713236.1 hypothetical protein [Sphingomonas sp.]